MDMSVDYHRHHGLAGEIHTLGAGRHANIGRPAGLCDFRALYTAIVEIVRKLR
jgi:hypothetical protein